MPSNFILGAFLLFLFRINDVVNGCGGSTHISIAHEAALFFEGKGAQTDYGELIWKHQDAFVAGNPYPDAMYPSLCFGGKYADTAEDTHWAPFLDATVNYIRDKYPQPWDKETEKLVAFMFGFISHQVADISWHSLGVEQGFIQTMSKLNFHGVYDKAHTDADVGGDMLTQFYNADKPVSIWEWYVPVDDLYNIYKDYYRGNKTIPKLVIEACSELLYIEYVAEKLAGAKLFEPFVKNSPFLYNHMENYFLGGIHDMAAWTSEIWREAVYMLEHGTERCNMAYNTMFVNCTGYLPSPIPVGSNQKKKNPGRPYPLRLDTWKPNDVNKLRSKRGVRFSPGDNLWNKLRKRFTIQNPIQKKKNPGRPYPLRLDTWKPNDVNELRSKSGVRFSPEDNFVKKFTKQQVNFKQMTHSYAQIGKTLEQITIGGIQHVVISAPTYSEPGSMLLGKVWIVPINKLATGVIKEAAHLDHHATSVLIGRDKMSKFGWSIVTCFYDDDDDEDLIISAPVFGSKNLNYSGAIYVYLGSETGIPTIPDITLTQFRNESNYSSPFANFGYSVSANRFSKGSIIVGNPFYRTRNGKAQNGIIWKNNGFFRVGYHPFDWFGYSVLEHSTVSGQLLMGMGCPEFRLCFLPNCSYHQNDKQAVGNIVAMFDYADYIYLTGNTEFEEFGATMEACRLTKDGPELLIIASPGKEVEGNILGVPVTLRQAGMVRVYNVSSSEDEPKIIATYSGDRAYGRFGETLKCVDVDGDDVKELIIGAPRRSRDLTEEIVGGEEGAVYIFKVLEATDDVNDCAMLDIKPCPSEKAWRYFIGEEPRARFGTAFTFVRNNSSAHLVIGAPTSSRLGFRSGMVHSINVPVGDIHE